MVTPLVPHGGVAMVVARPFVGHVCCGIAPRDPQADCEQVLAYAAFQEVNSALPGRTMLQVTGVWKQRYAEVGQNCLEGFAVNSEGKPD